MPRSKSGVKRVPVDPDAMKKAIEAITADPDRKISIREACKVYSVKLATLSRNLAIFKKSGAETYKYSTNFDVNRVFSVEEEKLLVEYIDKVAKMKYGLSKKGVRQLAYKFAVANEKKIPENWNVEKIAGEQWMRCFMRRHSNTLSIRKPEATSLSRSTSFNKTNVEDVHDRFGPIPPHRIWNIDETGMTTVQTPAPIVAPKGVKQIGGCTSAERGTLITMIVAINAIGNHIPPMLIFPRVYFKDRMLIGASPGTIGAATPSGWSNDEMFLKFLEHFISHVKCSKEERILLVIDNHETHLSVNAVERASDAGIVMVTFPPHTSHKLQPLDVTVYGPFKTFYNQGVDAWHRNNPGRTFDIYCVSQVIGTVFPRAFSTKNIASGFKTPGVYPLDRGVFTEDDFLSSFVTDRPLPEDGPRPTETPDRPTSCSLPGPSTPQPTSITQTQNIITPEQVQPYPKANPRKAGNRGRKPGRTRIATDTPEKEEIRKEKNKKQLKKHKEENKAYESKKQNKAAKRKSACSSSSSEDDFVPLVSTDDEDSADEECLYCNQPYRQDKGGEQWIRCVICLRWTHELCAGSNKSSWKTYRCDFCTRALN